MKNLSKKDLEIILERDIPVDIKKKIANILGLKTEDHTYTEVYTDENGLMGRWATPEEAHDEIEKLVGKWSSKTAEKWSNYYFIDTVFNTEESSYSY